MNVPIWFANLLFWSAQVAVLVIVAWAMTRLLRMSDPRVLLVFWRGLLLICFVLPLIQPWHHSTIAFSPARSEQQAIAPTAFVPVLPQSHWRIPTLEQPAPIIAVTILAVIAIRFGLFALGLLKLRQLRRTSSPVSTARDTCAGTLDAARNLVGASANFHLTRDVDSPVTFGLVSPTILLPERFPSLESHMQTGIACHELLHVRRRDWSHHLAEEVVRALLWFHPAILWMIGRIRLSREQVVDLEVVRLIEARKPYLEALLEFTARPRSRFAAIPAPPFLEERQLAERVALMLKEVRMSRTRLIASLSTIACSLCIAAIAVIWAFPLKAAARRAQSVAGASESQTAGNQYMMEINVTVKAKDGADIAGLTADDFLLFEDGAQQKLEYAMPNKFAAGSGYSIGFASAKDANSQFHRIALRLAQKWGSAGEDYTVAAGEAHYSKLTGGIAGGITSSVSGEISQGVSSRISQGISGGISQGISQGISSGMSSGPSRGIDNGVPGGVSGGVSDGVNGGVNGAMRVTQSSRASEAIVGRDSIWPFTARRGTMPLVLRGLGKVIVGEDGQGFVARIEVPSAMAADVQVGQAVDIVRGAGQHADGRISSVDRSSSGETTIVYVKPLQNLPRAGTIENEVTVFITTGQLKDALFIGRPVRSAANSEGSIFRISKDGVSAERVTVEYGRASVNTIQILSGLNEGDSVILSDMSAYDNFNRIQIKQ